MNRRDFLKLAGLLPLSLAAPRWPRLLTGAAGQQNVLVVVFDAWSAYDVSLYGYPRQTTPHIDELAKRAIVYRDHYAASNFTTSGTASLLTGTFPWTHRAIAKNGRTAEAFSARTLFDAMPGYYRMAYTHNEWAATLLREFSHSIDRLVPRQQLYLQTYQSLLSSLFGRDSDIAAVSWTRDMKLDEGYAYSLFLSSVLWPLQERQLAAYEADFPRGVPTSGYYDAFLLEQAVDWIAKWVQASPQPFLGYFHFLPPHAPYNPPAQYVDMFKGDRMQPFEKPLDSYAVGTIWRVPFKWRTEYDQFLLYVDREFARFFDLLERSGVLENTWLILTSDHGELFERGIVGHNTNVLYEPLLRIPLLIFEPGRTQGMDVRERTSAVDLLPTLTHLTGHPIPPWAEGSILPPFASAAADPGRKLYALRATQNDPVGPLTEASLAMLSGRYKLHYYFGYSEYQLPDVVKLFDVQADPEEMTDLSQSQADVAAGMLRELRARLDAVNKPYL